MPLLHSCLCTNLLSVLCFPQRRLVGWPAIKLTFCHSSRNPAYSEVVRRPLEKDGVVAIDPKQAFIISDWDLRESFIDDKDSFIDPDQRIRFVSDQCWLELTGPDHSGGFGEELVFLYCGRRMYASATSQSNQGVRNWYFLVLSTVEMQLYAIATSQSSEGAWIEEQTEIVRPNSDTWRTNWSLKKKKRFGLLQFFRGRTVSRNLFNYLLFSIWQPPGWFKSNDRYKLRMSSAWWPGFVFLVDYTTAAYWRWKWRCHRRESHAYAELTELNSDRKSWNNVLMILYCKYALPIVIFMTFVTFLICVRMLCLQRTGHKINSTGQTNWPIPLRSLSDVYYNAYLSEGDEGRMLSNVYGKQRQEHCLRETSGC